MSKHLPKLIQMAQVDVPILQNDVLSATGPFQLREICMKLIKIVGYLLQDRILDAYDAMPSSIPVIAPVVPPVVPPPQLPRAEVATLPRLPPLPDVAQPARAAAPASNLPGDVPIQPGITNAFITPQGTTVVAPSGVRSVLPPGEAVPLEVSAAVPPELPEAPNGVANVVLPRGGEMSPETAAALSDRNESPK